MAGKRRFTAGYVALRFFVYSVLYIILSDWLLYYLVSEPVAMSRLQTAKGWGYVGLAAILIFVLLTKHQREIDRSFEEQKQTETQLRSYIKDLDLLVDVSAALREAEDISQMLPVLLDKTLHALGTDAGTITLFDVKTDALLYGLSRGWFSATTRMPKKPTAGISGHVYATGKLYVVEDFATDRLTRDDARSAIPAQWGGACVPLRAHATTIGVMFVAVEHPRVLTADELKIVSALADMASVALHRTFLYEETMSRLLQLQSLRQIDLAIISSPRLTPTVELIVEEVRQHLSVDAASIYLLDEAGNRLIYSGGSGIANPPVAGSTIELSGSGLAAVIDKQESKTTPCGEGGTSAVCPLNCMQRGFAACMSIPLTTQGRTVGLLTLLSKSEFRQDREWIGFLETLAGQATIAVETSRLFTEAEQSRQELQAAYESTIEGWSYALDMRDKETEGHSRRVMELTVSLAEAMGVPTDRMMHLRRGAMLHDVGKMAIPDNILHKPESLSEAEWAVMRLHPVYARQMLEGIEYLQPALTIPYGHHEKWDGTGYPLGLKGQDIPLEARIFAVVDVYDALLSHRPYRPAWGENDALAYIAEQKGAHFDPDVVDGFFRLMGKLDVS